MSEPFAKNDGNEQMTNEAVTNDAVPPAELLAATDEELRAYHRELARRLNADVDAIDANFRVIVGLTGASTIPSIRQMVLAAERKYQRYEWFRRRTEGQSRPITRRQALWWEVLYRLHAFKIFRQMRRHPQRRRR